MVTAYQYKLYIRAESLEHNPELSHALLEEKGRYNIFFCAYGAWNYLPTSRAFSVLINVSRPS